MRIRHVSQRHGGKLLGLALLSALLLTGCTPGEAPEDATVVVIPLPSTPVPTPAASLPAAPEAVKTAAPTPVETALPTVRPTAAPAPSYSPSPAPAEKETATPAAEKETPSPTQASGEEEGKFSNGDIDRVAALVNAYRAQYGLEELRSSSTLNKAAKIRARELAEVFSHTRPDGSSGLSISDKAWGENIGMGQGLDADTVMTGWMNSQGHRENILRETFTILGVGFYEKDGMCYWVQLFGY